jgi:hypothetical protein
LPHQANTADFRVLVRLQILRLAPPGCRYINMQPPRLGVVAANGSQAPHLERIDAQLLAEFAPQRGFHAFAGSI